MVCVQRAEGLRRGECGEVFQADGLADTVPEVGVGSVGSESKKKRVQVEHSEG